MASIKAIGVAVQSYGTSLQGYVNVPFSKLVAVFGEPSDSDGYKVAFEWSIEFDDGVIATIYDWKSTSLYDDDLPSPAYLRDTDFDSWHVGGFDKRAVTHVLEAIANHSQAAA